jgi:carbonic anhydrase
MAVLPVSRRFVVQALAAGAALLGAKGALAETAPHWTYEGGEGPEHWGGLSPDYAACGAGRRQSPIDLAPGHLAQSSELAVHWRDFPFVIEHNGHTIQVSGENKNYLTLDGKTFAFAQFHFHHPSEHALRGDRWPLEIHFVHKGEKGDLAVLGVFVRPGRENGALTAIVDRMPSSKGKNTGNGTLDMTRLLPGTDITYRYEGSLTTPPCSEVVHWIVFRDPIEAGIGQIESLASLLPMNARPLQPLSGRQVEFDLF